MPKNAPKNNHLGYKFFLRKSFSILFTTLSVLILSAFAIWWFDMSHIPNNFTGNLNFLDLLLFGLVSFVIFHPLVMEVLTWCIASHIKDIKEQKPVPNLRVAFITTIVPKNEPVELLHKCLPAMVNADYPHDTWILDEGNNPEVKKVCDMYGVYHFSRNGIEEFNTKKGKYTKTKGGNHNSWYDSFGHNYDYVAQIDTDFVPLKSFLTKTLGYFRDPKVAFVGTPQIYGNIKKSIIARGAAEQQYNFYGAVLRGLSGFGMTLLIGANHVIRVKTFKKANHYTAHITEDLVTGMKLHAEGWKSVYVPHALAIGEGPASWESYFNQQLRWAYGCMDILFHHSFGHFRKMKLRQIIYYFFLEQHYFSGIAMALSITLLTVYFIFGIRAADVDMFRFLLFYSFILIVCWLMSVWMGEYGIDEKNKGSLNLAGKMISIAAWPIWFAAFISIVIGKPLTYKVTPKGDEEGEEQLTVRSFIPHFSFATVAIGGLVSSLFTQKQSPVMQFWAISAATTMMSIPFAHDFVKIWFHIRSAIFWTVRKFLSGSKNVQTTLVDTTINGGDAVYDLSFLTFIVIASMFTYINKIGFYSDDWSFLGEFTLSKDQSFLGLIKTATTPNTFMRPMQNVYDAFLYKMFGLNPLGYHLFNSVVFLLIVITLYLILKQLKLPRIIAVATPLIYALLPNYSTDRFWYAAFQVNLSMLLFSISTYAGLKAIALKDIKSLNWKVVSLTSLILSVLSYEVVLPLVFLNAVLFWNPLERFAKKGKQKVQNNAVFITVNFIALFYLAIFKIKTTIRLDNFNYPGDVGHLLTSITKTNIIELGIKLPSLWLKSLILNPDLTSLGIGTVMAMAIFIYLYVAVSKFSVRFPDNTFMRNLALIGFIIFVMGYGVFFANNRVGFSPVGIDNRVAIASSVGVAFMIVGLLGWVSRRFLPKMLFGWFFCFVISLFCAGEFIMVETLASYWNTAYAEGKTVLSDIHQNVGSLPQNSVLLLDGVCPYRGPAIIFESQWDLKGALQTMYNDPTIQADIVTPRLKVTESGIQTQIYTFKANYSYNNTYVYNYHNKRIYRLNDAAATNAYFAEFNPDHNNGCPPSVAGSGVNIY